MTELYKQSKTETVIQTTLIIIVCVVLFVLLSQPVWRGNEMIAQLKDDCSKRGGVMLQHEGWLSTSYECASRLDGKQ